MSETWHWRYCILFLDSSFLFAKLWILLFFLTFLHTTRYVRLNWKCRNYRKNLKIFISHIDFRFMDFLCKKVAKNDKSPPVGWKISYAQFFWVELLSNSTDKIITSSIITVQCIYIQKKDVVLFLERSFIIFLSPVQSYIDPKSLQNDSEKSHC